MKSILLNISKKKLLSFPNVFIGNPTNNNIFPLEAYGNDRIFGNINV